MKTNKRFLLSVLVFLLAVLSFVSCVSQEKEEKPSDVFKVIRAVDGDTILIENGEEVQLIGVDALEMHESEKLDKDAKRLRLAKVTVEVLGQESAAFTSKLCRHKKVRLEYDQTERDKHNRLLAYVYLPDGRLLNEEILLKGYGLYYDRYPFRQDMMERLRKAYEKAKEEQCGILECLPTCYATGQDKGEKKLEKMICVIWDGSTDEEKELIKSVFDLKKPEVTKFLIKQMNIPMACSCGTNKKDMRARTREPILLAKHEEGLLWLLENYDDFTAVGRNNMLYCIRHFECKELYEILIVFLEDKKLVPRGRSPHGPPYMRVCDCAKGALGFRCWKAMPEELGKEIRKPVFRWDSDEEKDKRINLLISWWESEDSQEFRQSKKSLSEEKGVDLVIVNKIKEQIKELRKKIADKNKNQ